ncbi:hypothetical protein MMC22_001115 [Lobaria immixta]|nr:hypothetical protein [Lobaria immixta]
MRHSTLFFFAAAISAALTSATACNSACYQSVCTSVPDEIKAAATACPGLHAFVSAGSITTNIPTAVSSTVLSATTNPKHTSPTVPASTSAVAKSSVAKSSTTVAPTKASGISSSAVTNTIAGQASTTSTSAAGRSRSDKHLGISAGAVLAVFMGIVYGV